MAHDTITFQDLDLIDTHTATVAFTSSTSSDPLPGFDDNTSLGDFTIDSSVAEDNSDTGTSGTLGWKFTVDNNNSIVQSLAEGQTITQVYTVTIDDGHTTGGTVEQAVTVTITGTNDAPVITADTSGFEGSNIHKLEEGDAPLSTSGELAVSDVDVTNTVAASVYDVSVGGTGAGSVPSGLSQRRACGDADGRQR